MAYCQIDETGYVTYIFPKFGKYARYKILTQQELERWSLPNPYQRQPGTEGQGWLLGHRCKSE
jgi:hypothetical protein